MAQKKEKSSKHIHSLNNLLTVITISVDLLLRDKSGKLSSNQKKHAKTIISSVGRIKKVVEKIKPTP